MTTHPHIQTSPFETRYASFVSSSFAFFLILVARILCTNSEFVYDKVQTIIADGGEGVILRKCWSLYSHGISHDLLKIKAARGDGEALVISVEAGNYVLKLPDNMTFTVAKKQVQTERKLKKGDIVSFFFENYSRLMVPVNPTIYRIRSDVSWKDIVGDFVRRNPQKQYLNAHSSSPLGKLQMPEAKARSFFMDLAKQRNFDPLVVKNWYTFDMTTLRNNHGRISLLFVNFVKRLKKAFPELNIQERKFTETPKNYWADMKNRRQFFDNLAWSKGLDPLNPETWYKIPQLDVKQQKGGQTIVNYAGGYTKTLQYLYPDIGLDELKFAKSVPTDYWQDEDNRRNFFVKFANHHGFDPLVAEHWYAFSRYDLLRFKKSTIVLRFYNSFVDALLILFPNIGLDVHKFRTFTPNYLDDKMNARNLFIRFANKKGFDPLVAENWYSVTRDEVTKSQKGAKQIILKYHNMRNLLSEIFPDIGLDWEVGNLYGHVPRNHWLDINNQKAFFDTYAKTHGFDPLVPENWNPSNMSALSSYKSTQSIGYLYNKNVAFALRRVYPNIGLDKYQETRKYSRKL